MRCSSVRQLYDDHARGVLPVELLTRIEEHLSGCAECRREFEINEQIAQLMRQGSEVAHPGGEYFEALGSRVLARLDEPEEDPSAAIAAAPGGGRRGGGWLQPLWMSGGAAAAALLALGLFGESDRPVLTSRPAIAAQSAFAPEGSVSVGKTSLAFAPGIASGPAAPSDSPMIVLSADSAKHTLVFGPGMEPSPLSAHSMAEVASLPPGGRADASAARTKKDETASDARGGGKIQSVALRARQEPASALPQELAEQMNLIRQQMAEGGDKALDAGLRDLEHRIDQQVASNGDLGNLPSVRQVRLFVDAQDALRSGRARDAGTLYRRIVMADPATPLAYRANLQLADLYYNEWADFQEAQRYYAQCKTTGGETAFTQTERDHIDRQLNRLRAHAGEKFESLALLHTVQRGDWPEVLAALRNLTALAGAGDLLPEAARTIVDRMQAAPAVSAAPASAQSGAEPGLPMDTAIAIYRLIETRAASEPNTDVRAWLELALGDMQLAPFQNMQAASNHYRLAVDAAGDSGAGRLAAAKRDQLVNRQLLDLVR